jgi:flagellar assembly protein FliH
VAVVMSLSKDDSFSEEELKALGLWEISTHFGHKPKPVVKEVPVQRPKAPQLTVEEIEQVQKQAYDEAYQQGQKDGYDKGFDEGKKAGHKAGYQEGYTLGQKEGSEKGYQDNLHLLRKQAGEFVHLMESLAEPFKELDDAVEQQLLYLVTALVKQIVRHEIKSSPEQILAVIHEAVHALPIASQKITLSLNPADAELVKKSLSPEDISAGWHVIEDAQVTQGGCRVKTTSSRIDLTVEQRFKTIVSNMLGQDSHGEVNE